MDTLTYGLVITLVGMGGTILGLYFIVLFVELVKRLFPYREEEGQKG
ncbi:OadG family protein [Syntrophobacter fumaroxidans]|nr:OadG-related small transporter subunit [Syntrophobacter fumaroxidans]